MKKIETEQMKKRLVEMLKEISAICEENQIEMSLTAGTLLGAVRHKGFIPWDDDIDIHIPRPQYNKLIEIMKKRNETNRNKLLCHELNENYLYPFAKYVDTKTILIEKGGDSGVEMGLYIDVFPIDGLGNSIKIATRHMRNLNKYICLNLALLVKPWRKNVSFIKNIAIACIRVFSKILGKEFIHRKIKNTINKYSYDNSKYVGEIVETVGEKRITIKEEMYAQYEEVEFEGSKFKAPKNWDVFLKKLYGDYMQLPPQDKRIATHNYELYAKNDEFLK